MDANNDTAINDALMIYLGTMRFFKIAEHLIHLKRFHIYHRDFWNNLNEHTHPYFEMLIPVAGEVRYSVGNRPIIPDSSKEIIIIPPATQHMRHIIKEGGTVVIIHFTFEKDTDPGLSDILKEELEKNFYVQNIRTPFPFDDVIHLCSSRPFLWKDYISNHIEKFFLDIFSGIPEKFFTLSEDGRRSGSNVLKKFKRFEQMVETTLDVRLSLAEYAKKIGISMRQLERRVRQYHNMTFSEYIRKRRFTVAEKLLADSGYSIKEIADAVGYDNVSYFCKVFKQYTNMTPLEYRNRK